jgi:L-fuconolactonase
MIPPRIDAHQHFWRLDRGDYGWLTPALAPLYRDFGPEDLAPLLAQAELGRTILVQAAPTENETRFLLGLAAASPMVAGVVGWVDLDAADAPDRIAALAADRKLVGIRPMIHDITDPDWILKPALAPAIEAITEHGLAFDALVRPIHLPRLARFIDRYSKLRLVVDHGAKPDIAEDGFQPWASDIARIAKCGHTLCKLSGLVTEAGPGWTVERLRPYVDHLLHCFGPGRLIWGSDWPVVDLAGGYLAWWRATTTLLASLSAAERTAVLGVNAARFYRLRI